VRTTFAIVGGNAKAGSAVRVTRNDQPGALQKSIVLAFREIFPRKTWLEIAGWFGLSERGAKHRLAGSREFTAEELAIMLRSEHGLRFLSAVMADARPRWWVAFKSQAAITNARRHEAAARRSLQEAVDATADLSAAIARTEILPDQDFHRGHVDALRTMGSLPNSAVASASKSIR
jgi:hypothetical protein